MRHNPVLLARFVDPVLGRIVERILCGRGRLVIAATADHLRALLAESGPDAVFLDLSGNDSELAHLVSLVHQRLPNTPVLLWTPLDSKRAGSVLRVAQQCPTSVVLIGYDDVAFALSQFLRTAFGWLTGAQVVRDLNRDISEEVQPILEFCLARLEQPPRLVEVAHAIGTSERTLERRVKQQCGLPTMRFLTCTRLLVAAWLIHTSPMCLNEVASIVGFGDSIALSHAMQRHVGVRPGSLRERDGFRSLVQCIRVRYPHWPLCEPEASLASRRFRS